MAPGESPIHATSLDSRNGILALHLLTELSWSQVKVLKCFKETPFVLSVVSLEVWSRPSRYQSTRLWFTDSVIVPVFLAQFPHLRSGRYEQPWGVTVLSWDKTSCDSAWHIVTWRNAILLLLLLLFFNVEVEQGSKASFCLKIYVRFGGWADYRAISKIT